VKTLWFVMPAHGRQALAAICLRQLRRTCDALADHGVDATAVVVADDTNLATGRELGFGTVHRDNRFLARKFNDGIQLACDPRVNPRPADYVVPIGSDDWVDHRILHQLPARDTVLGFRLAAFVSEDGQKLTEARVDYPGGVGVRVYPRQLLKVCGYRPADEDRSRACDTSILTNVRAALHRRGRELRISYGDQHPLQIVDWKSLGTQLHSYADILGRHRGRRAGDPFDALAGVYPAEALAEMADHYQLVPA
jgi:hypothetical protein